MHGADETELRDKGPASLGLLGAGLAVAGVIPPFTPLAVGVGCFSMAVSGGYYLEIGQNLAAPPPPAPDNGPA